MNSSSGKSKPFCHHIDCRFKRLGILHDPDTNGKYYLLICQSCGSTITTRTLRAQKELRKAQKLGLRFA